MKFKYLIISLAVLIFVSCNKQPKYQLGDLSNPLLDEWFDNFKAADSTFSAEKFIPTYFSDEKTLAKSDNAQWYGDENQLYSFEPQPANIIDWAIYSPDSSFYLDLDFYSAVDGTKEGDIWYGGDIDTKTILVDMRNNKALDIIPTNCCNGADDAFWVNDSVFVMLCQAYDFQNEEWYPYISVWNREKEIVHYFYDGKINNFRDEKYSAFFKRLQRKGLRIKDIGE